MQFLLLQTKRLLIIVEARPFAIARLFTTSTILNFIRSYVCHLSSDRAVANMKWQIEPFIESKNEDPMDISCSKTCYELF